MSRAAIVLAYVDGALIAAVLAHLFSLAGVPSSTAAEPALGSSQGVPLPDRSRVGRSVPTAPLGT